MQPRCLLSSSLQEQIIHTDTVTQILQACCLHSRNSKNLVPWKALQGIPGLLQRSLTCVQAGPTYAAVSTGPLLMISWLPGQLLPPLSSHSVGGCFLLLKAPSEPSTPFSPHDGPYGNVFPFPGLCEIPEYISPSVPSSQHLCTNLQAGTLGNVNQNPNQTQHFQVIVRHPYKALYIFQAKPTSTFLI